MKKLPLISLSGLLAVSGWTATNPAPLTATNVLRQFAQARQNMKPFIIECLSVVRFNYREMRWNGTAYHKEEYRYDGNRHKWHESLWGNVAIVTPNVKESRPDYTSVLWNGKDYYYYARGGPTQRGGATIYQGRSLGNAIQRGLVGEIMGYPRGDELRLDELFLTRAAQLQLRPQAALVRGAKCHVLDAVVTGSGRYTVWIDPEHDFYPVRIEVERKAGEGLDGKADLQSGEYRNDTFEVVRFDRLGSVWFPKECKLTTQGYGSGRHFTEERAVSISKVVWNPNHEALKSFVPDDIPDGTPVRFRDLPASRVFVWRDGRALDEAGHVQFDSGLRSAKANATIPVGRN